MSTIQSILQRSLFIACLLLGQFALAQINNFSPLAADKTIELTTPNIIAAVQEDKHNDQYKTIPYRFGIKIPCNYTPQNEGFWTKSGDYYNWQMRIHAKDAKSLHFNFTSFALKSGESVLVFNDSKTIVYGPYTKLNNSFDSLFSSFLIPGENINILFQSKQKQQNPFIIESVTYGYRSIGEFVLKNFGASGACHNNINCPIGENWQKEKRSVALILVNGNGWCTGSLLNNTLQDTTPYLLTANHCSSSSYSNWQFAFNWESPGCGTQLVPLNNVMVGATYIASSALSDFLLIKLNNKIPDSFHPYFNGWDFQNIASDTVVCIHHPSGDLKKISVANNLCQDSSYFNAFCWKIGQWSNGVTEGGSSGSPLFNKEHQVVGLLTGGPSFCCSAIQDLHDYFGKFAVAWNADTALRKQLKYWLDPNGMANNNWNAFDPSPINAYPGDAVQLLTCNQIQGIAFSCADSNSVNIHFKNNGTTILNSLQFAYKINQQATKIVNWSGNLKPGQATDFIIYSLKAYQSGTNDLKVWSRLPNNNQDVFPSDDTLSVNINYIFGATLKLQLKTDDFGSETRWEIKNSSGTLFYTGGPYTDFAGGQTINENICLMPGCYQLSVEDLGGDGMCCQNGNGSFILYNSTNKSILSGSQFTCSIQGNFCVNANGNESIETAIHQDIYPNPCDKQLILPKHVKQVQLFDPLHHEITLEVNNGILDTSTLKNGVYLIVFDNNRIGKLIVQHQY